MTPEGKVKQGVKKVLVSKGAWYYMPVQNGMGRSGIPDFIACVPTVITADMVGKTIGQLVAVETKAPGRSSNATHNQIRELTEIAEHGGLAILADDPAFVEDALGGPPLINRLLRR